MKLGDAVLFEALGGVAGHIGTAESHPNLMVWVMLRRSDISLRLSALARDGAQARQISRKDRNRLAPRRPWTSASLQSRSKSAAATRTSSPWLAQSLK